jgi:hypothetical protein
MEDVLDAGWGFAEPERPLLRATLAERAAAHAGLQSDKRKLFDVSGYDWSRHDAHAPITSNDDLTEAQAVAVLNLLRLDPGARFHAAYVRTYVRTTPL